MRAPHLGKGTGVGERPKPGRCGTVVLHESWKKPGWQEGLGDMGDTEPRLANAETSDQIGYGGEVLTLWKVMKELN